MDVRFRFFPFGEPDCVIVLAAADDIENGSEESFSVIPRSEIVGADAHICRYKKLADRNRSALGFAALGKCLEYFDIAPSSARLSLLESGKPVLDNGIEFNISHSDNIAVCIAHRRLAVGIDIERIEFNTSNADLRLKVAKRLFTDAELQQIYEHSVPEAEFTRLWTQREAVGKYLGVGFFQGNAEKYVLENNLTLKSAYLSLDAETVCENLFDGASYVMTICIGSEGKCREK